MAKVFRNTSLLLVAATTATALTSSDISPSGGSEAPDPRMTAKGCVDTSNSKLFIHGGGSGFQGGSTGVPGVRYGDLWAYDLVGKSWTELDPSDTKPLARDSHVAAMDTANNKLLIHGGRTATASDGVDDLWAYDIGLNSWTQLEPSGTTPGGRYGHVAAMDTKNSKLLIHAGKFKDDLWAYDLGLNSWTELEPSGTKPGGRYLHAAAMDTKNSKLFIHGGGSGFMDDLWAYDLGLNSWTKLEPSGTKPLGRRSHVAAMDTAIGRLFIHGGDRSGALDDLWAYDLGLNSWTELEPSGAMPAARYGHMAAIADGSRLIIFGGFISSTTMDGNDVWQFAWVTSTTTTTTTSMTNTSSTSTSATSTSTKATSTSTTVNTTRTTVTTTVSLEVSAVCKCSAPSLFFPLFCVACLATM